MTDNEREATLTLLEMANTAIKVLVGRLGGSVVLTRGEIRQALDREILVTEQLDEATRFTVRGKQG